ncbi:MAG TPA: DUF6279 family lipoprotein [Rubrivivax sp.]|nr:DUF6279 family lipoprotein [Rubrivivax sp.]
MQLSRRWSVDVRTRIIGVPLVAIVLALAGCSAVRLSYNNGAQLAWWWLDDHLDFPRERVDEAKAAIDRWFEWHRRSQLTGYAALLAQMSAQAAAPTSAAATCRLWAGWRERADVAIDRALVLAAELVPGLDERQLQHLERRYAKNIERMRGEYLQADAPARQRAAFDRALERAEQVYGTLGEAQRKVLAEGVAASPFDAEAWLRERQQRQRDVVATLRRLVDDPPGRARRLAALRTLAAGYESSPDPAYRAQQRRVVDYNCELAARLHNATTPAQRERARRTFEGWEGDMRALLAAPAVPGATLEMP